MLIILFFFVILPISFILAMILGAVFQSRAKKAALANGWPSLAVCRNSLRLSSMRSWEWKQIINAHGAYKPPGSEAT